MEFIINPNAGRLKRPGILNKVTNFIRNRFPGSHKFWVTKGVFHAAELAHHAVTKGVNTIISVGGDGTLSEIIHSVIGKKVSIGLVPMGAGNDFARNLNLPKDPFDVLGSLLSFKKKKIDVGRINDKYFINVAGTGIDSKVLEVTRKSKNYFLGFYRALSCHIPMNLKIKIDQKEYFLKDVSLIAIANGKYFGHNMLVSPHSEIDDGVLDVIIIKGISKLKLFLLFPEIYTGKHIKNKYVQIIKAKQISITHDKELLFQKDGELYRTASVDISVLPKAVEILVP